MWKSTGDEKKINESTAGTLEPLPIGHYGYVQVIDPLVALIGEKQKALLASRDTLRLQLNGIENQLFLIEQLLHPEPPQADPDASPAPPPDGHV